MAVADVLAAPTNGAAIGRCRSQKNRHSYSTSSNIIMFSLLPFNLVTGYAEPYDTARDTYLEAAQTLKQATGPYKAARDAYVAATATYTKSLYE
jgi:hypothetical protein